MNDQNELNNPSPTTPVNGESHPEQPGQPQDANLHGGSETAATTAKNHQKNRRKRTQRQIHLDLELIDRLSREGLTQAEIAEGISATRTYTLSRSQIRQDLRKIDKLWRAQFTGSITERRLKELARIEQLEDAAWFGWMKSLEPRTSCTVNSNGIPGDGGERKNSCNQTQNGFGDPRFLKVLAELEKLRCKLLGLLTTTTGFDPSPAPQKLTAGELGVEVGSRWNGGLGMKSLRSNG